MKLKKHLSLALAMAFSIFSLSVSTVMAESSTVSIIAEELMCQCGCSMVLGNCSHAECGSREAMTTLIEQKLAQGEPKAQIIQYFIAQYGEQVLAVPPKQGFNLIAWLLPVAALLLGGVVIQALLKNWLKRGRDTQTIPIAEETDEQYKQWIEKELEEFTERGFR
ncbi:cytochrome c-type biogenesis protein CcmH [Chloroflexota bacterium]